MKRLIILVAVMLCFAVAFAQKFSYRFNHTPLADALTQIAEQNPDIHINFIYNELDKYPVTANIHTDDAYEMLRQLIGLNPVSIICSGGRYYVEALQHGKFIYRGRVVGDDNEPVAAATVMLLAPKDSTVITYGIADGTGRFSIPCDSRGVIAKLTCVGYKTTYRRLTDFNVGTITMPALPIVLNTVTKQPDYTIYETDKSVYIPTSRQKNASRTAIDLLRRMSIPQIVLSIESNTVKDVAGNTVPVFINFHATEEMDLKGINISDVRKIEFIENPTDPRFRGAAKVLNIIVQEFEYGGYSKALIDETCLNGFTNDNTIFNRFSYRQCTYDLYIGATNTNYHHKGYDTEAQYTLGEGENIKHISRTEMMLNSHEESSKYPVSFRAMYGNDKFETRNILSFTHNATPVRITAGRLNTELSSENDYSYTRNNPNHSNSAGYNGSFWSALSKGFSLEVSPQFVYTHRVNNSDYSTNLSIPIHYVTREDAYNWNVNASAQKSFGSKHHLNAGFNVGQFINILKYTGSYNYDDSYKIGFVSGNCGYSFQTNNLYVKSQAGLVYEYDKLNGNSRHDICPSFTIYFGYTINKHSRIGGYAYLQNSTPNIGMKVNDIIRVNEVMYYTANPELKSWHKYRTNLAYNWFNKNIWRMAVFAGYDMDAGRVATIYEPYDNGNGIIRKFINNGNYERGYAGMQINCNLFDGSLQLYANVTHSLYRTTGIYERCYNNARVQLQASYYWHNFSLLGYYSSPECKLTENSNIIIRGCNNYGIQLGWGNGKWVFGLNARNFFNRGWKSSTWEQVTPLYSEYRTYYTPSSHPSVTVSVTYTIGYGRKIKRGNEIGTQDDARSAILK